MKRINKQRISFIHALGVIPLVMLLYYILLDVHTNIYGIPQTVTVSFYKTIPGGRGRSPTTVSGGYYYVEGKRYFVHTGNKVPIGTKFEMKYNPIIPSTYSRIRIIQD
jgi:hypothetical protein